MLARRAKITEQVITPTLSMQLIKQETESNSAFPNRQFVLHAMFEYIQTYLISTVTIFNLSRENNTECNLI